MSNFKLPDFTLPAPIARLGTRLPQLPPTLALIAGLNLALDRMIPREPLEPLIGKRFAIRVLDAGMTLRFASGRPTSPSRRAAATSSPCWLARKTPIPCSSAGAC